MLDAPEGPGGIFVHFSSIEVEGYKTLREDEVVEVDLEGPLSLEQDGYRVPSHESATARLAVRVFAGAPPFGQAYAKARAKRGEEGSVA